MQRDAATRSAESRKRSRTFCDFDSGKLRTLNRMAAAERCFWSAPSQSHQAGFGDGRDGAQRVHDGRGNVAVHAH